MVVILRPIAKKSWSGLIKYRNCFEDIGTYLTKSGGIYTGLKPEDEKRLGDLLGVDLRQSSDFWNTFYIRTTSKDLYLNTDDPRDELKYLFLKNHRRVKNSVFENKASANFVLINKDEEARKSNLYSRMKRDAIKAFDSMTPTDMRKCLRLYGHSSDSMSNELVEKTLFDIIEGNPESFLNRWVNNEDRETEFIIEKAISKNVIRKNKNLYLYGTDTIGHSLVDTISFLKDYKNQDILISIMKQIDSKEFIDEKPIVEEQVKIEEPLVGKPKNKKGVSIVVDEEEIEFNKDIKNRISKNPKDTI